MIGKTGDITSACGPGPPDDVVVVGARTPEELETLFEDALVVRDCKALAKLFEEGSVLVVRGGPTAHGGEEITRLVMETWKGDRIYIADPQRVLQARDLALIVADRGITVVHRGSDGAWRYAISLLSLDDTITDDMVAKEE